MSQQEDRQNLRELMGQEVALLRELLASMEEEQQALLTCDTERLQQVMKTRDVLMESIEGVRNQRIDTLCALSDGKKPADLSEEDCHKIIEKCADDECCEILILRDQLFAILEAMNQQNSRNSYLLDAKIQTTRQLVRRLHPDDPNKTYSSKGDVKKNVKTATVAMINQEG